ncbi:MAG: acetyltransferase [Pseudomonadota bacterium]
MTLTSLTFRDRAPDDNAAVHRVWARAVQATHTFLSADDFAEISDLVCDQYVPNTRLDLALHEGRIIGFMGMTDLHIDSLFIDPDWTGQGLGRQFLARARRKGRPITVDVNEQNAGAVAFYRRLGFVQTDRSALDADGRPYPILYLIDTYDPR